MTIAQSLNYTGMWYKKRLDKVTGLLQSRYK